MEEADAVPGDENGDDDNKADRELQALKLITDWSKWLVTVETAAIGLFGYAAKTGEHPADNPWVSLPVCLAVTAFALSIGNAAGSFLRLAQLGSMRAGLGIFVRDEQQRHMVKNKVFRHLFFEVWFFIIGMVCASAAVLNLVGGSLNSPGQMWASEHERGVEISIAIIFLIALCACWQLAYCKSNDEPWQSVFTVKRWLPQTRPLILKAADAGAHDRAITALEHTGSLVQCAHCDLWCKAEEPCPKCGRRLG